MTRQEALASMMEAGEAMGMAVTPAEAIADCLSYEALDSVHAVLAYWSEHHEVLHGDLPVTIVRLTGRYAGLEYGAEHSYTVLPQFEMALHHIRTAVAREFLEAMKSHGVTQVIDGGCLELSDGR